MNRDDIIRMAREAGWIIHDLPYMGAILERFFTAAYAAGAAAERKYWLEQLEVEIHEAVLEEREACAQICDAYIDRFCEKNLSDLCAEDIRARGTQ